MKMFRFRRFETCHEGDVQLIENLAISTRPKCWAILSYRVQNDYIFLMIHLDSLGIAPSD